MPFSGYAEVVPSKCWKQAGTDRTASIYGCKPHGEGWEIVQRGWDIRWTGDGTVGRCKPPFETKEEADAYAVKWNAEQDQREQARAYHDQISDRLVDEAFEDIGD